MNRNTEMTQIRRLIGLWITEIGLANAESYYDINKVSEHLCRQLLNLIFDYELIDLNTEQNPNFPGLDIGDKTKSNIAFQITSRTDNRKIFKTLKTVVDNAYDKTFCAGIKFLILNASQKIKFGKKAKQPDTILATFDPSKDILHPEDLIKKIEAIYEEEADLIKFNKVKLLLEKELSLKYPTALIDQQSMETKVIKDLISKRLIAEEKETSQINVSYCFFDDDFEVPSIKNLIPRAALAGYYIELLQERLILWLHGPLSTGKTSIAVAMSKKVPGIILWVECRGIEEEQLVEHILNALIVNLKIKVSPNARFKKVVDIIVDNFPSDMTIIFNDLPLLNKARKSKDHFSYLAGEILSTSSSMLITSNYSTPESLLDNEDFLIVQEEVPPFNSDETSDLLKAFGASKEQADSLKNLITTSTQGHPLLIRSAAKYLAEKEWLINETDLVGIFTGKFDLSIDQTTYAALLNATTDEKTRELLYRLKYVIGSFEIKTADLIGSIKPPIDRIGERLNELNGTWLQENREGYYRVSPLIKKLGDNVPRDVKMTIYEELAKEIVSKKNISQIEASSAIIYFSLAGNNNQAAILLIRVLNVFASTPKIFFDWSFDMHWFRTVLPEDILPHLQVQIRAGQLAISVEKEEDITFLEADLEKIISQDGIGLLDRYLGNNILFQQNFKKAPLRAMDKLTAIDTDGKALSGINEFKELYGDKSLLVDIRIFNGIWLIFSKLSKIEDLREWFNKLNPCGYPEQITDPATNDSYAMAGVSIYRNFVLANLESGDVKKILKETIELSIQNELYLLAAYGIKFLMKYLVEKGNGLDEALSIVIKYENFFSKSDIYRYLVYTELGRLCLINGKEDDAFKYLDPFLEFQLPEFYTEQLDYKIAISQLYYKKDPKISSAYSISGLNKTIKNPFVLIEDKLKMYGEAAIGFAHLGEYKQAISLLAQGYEMVLNNFQETDEYKAIVIRYGHTILYVVQSMSPSGSKDFGNGEKFVIPYPGMFYHENEKLLKGGFYFEERKFMVSSLAYDGFEILLDHINARKWAYKSIELGTALVKAKFFPILQKFVFFPVEEKQYRHAYNLLSAVEKFYQDLIKNAENGSANKEEQLLIERARKTRSIDDDFGIYLFIIFPVALDFSLRIVTGDLISDQFQSSIDRAFENDKYLLINEKEFGLAKMLFEKIMIERIDYEEFKVLSNELTGSNKDFIYAIGCFLLCSFSDAIEAASLQLANVIILEKTLQTMIPFYNFQIIPYFQKFWLRKFITNRNDFKSPEHLEEKGMPLIERTESQKRVKKIFQVLINHLPITLTRQIEDFIDHDP